MEPSSSNSGFFQTPPVLRNQYYDDVSFQRITKLFVPSSVLEQVEPEIAQLGEDVLSQQIFDWIGDAEKNQPYLRGSGRDMFGKPKSELVMTEGWRKLQDFGFKKGVIAFNYDTDLGPFTRIIQFLRIHLWGSSCGNTLCPAAMQDGAARLLQRHLSKTGIDPAQRRVLQNAFDRLISRDPARTWTSGQWMTERTGGSDVSQTETVATFKPYPDGTTRPLADNADGTPLGPFDISGFKWFSSATDSNMTILLAKTSPDKGLSTFMAPLRRHNPALLSPTGKPGGTELNGVRISRLKNKFGTQSLPTAELELAGMRGWMVGEEGRGIQEISTILNITRVHSTVTSVGALGRSLGIAKAYALVREVGIGRGKRVPLHRHPLHMRTLASMTTEYHSLMLLVFYTLYVLGLDERGSSRQSHGDKLGTSLAAITPPRQHIAPLLRVLSSLHKAYVCESVLPLIYGCMAALGGVGYLNNTEAEHLNIARHFRDVCVNAIWEGTTDVLSSDTVRALKHPAGGKESLAALDWFVSATLGSEKSGQGGESVAQEWEAVKTRIESESADTLLPDARQLVFRIAEILIAGLFVVDVSSNSEPHVEVMCRRYLTKKSFGSVKSSALKEDLAMDAGIVYGSDWNNAQGLESRL